MQMQTWHPPLRPCIHAKYYVKSGLTNVLKNANKTKNMHLFSIRIATYMAMYCIIFVGDVTELMFTMARATVKRSTVCHPNITA